MRTVGQTIDLTDAQLATARAQMRGDPKPLSRPVIVLGGYRALPSMAWRVVDHLAPMTAGVRDQFLAVSYPTRSTFSSIVPMVVRRVEQRFPSDDPDRTIEVDVVGISMGGIVARLAALPLVEGDARTKRLNIHALYTLATPHRGAKIAAWLPVDPLAYDMRPGSAMIDILNDSLPDPGYEIVPYAHLRDTWVGATRSAPPGTDPIWTGGTWALSHFTVADDPLVMLDIARRLRHEPSVAGEATRPPRD